MKMRKWPLIVVLIGGILFGYGQEYLKVAVNFAVTCSMKDNDWDAKAPEERLAQLETCRENRPTDYYHNHKPLMPLGQLTRGGLSMFKWGLAFVFVLFYWAAARWGLSIGYRGEFPIRILDFSTASLGILCVLVFAVGYLFNLAPAYDVAREILGGLQSLVPFAILLLGYSLYLRLNN